MTTLTEKTIGEIFNDNKTLKEKFLTAMNETYIFQKNLKSILKEILLNFGLQKLKICLMK